MSTATNQPRHSTRSSSGLSRNLIGKLVGAAVVVALLVAGYVYSHHGDASTDGAGAVPVSRTTAA